MWDLLQPSMCILYHRTTAFPNLEKVQIANGEGPEEKANRSQDVTTKSVRETLLGELSHPAGNKTAELTQK